MFDRTTLELFLRLERVPQDTDAFRRASRELARRLDLESEWLCQTCHVNDQDAAPCWPPQHYATGVWYRVRAVRRTLLDAVAAARERPAGLTGACLKCEPWFAVEDVDIGRFQNFCFRVRSRR
jgi:hypothetical protein